MTKSKLQINSKVKKQIQNISREELAILTICILVIKIWDLFVF